MNGAKAIIKNLHIMKINSIYFTEYQHLLKVLHLSNTVLQRNYLLLRANSLIDCTMQDSYDELKKLNQGQRDVKFFGNCIDDNSMATGNGASPSTTTNALEHFNITINEHMLNSELALLGEEDMAITAVPAKRMRLDVQKRTNKKLFTNELTRNVKTAVNSIRTVTTKPSTATMGPPKLFPPSTATIKPTTSSVRVNFDETHVISSNDLDLVDIEMKSPLAKLPDKNLNGKTVQIRSKPNLLKNILAENNTLYSKGK